MGSSAKAAKPMPPLEIVLPASSANLGPAFDAAAIAVRLHLRIRASVADEFSIVARGRDANLCGRLEHNLLLETYEDVLRAQRRNAPPLAIRVDNQIPLGKGLGSSAAARLAAVALADHFGRLRWSDDRILAEAADREQHADNAAACWLGGIVLVHSNGSHRAACGKLGALRLRARLNWPLLLAVTDTPLSTQEARALLPDQYSRSDAIANVQSAMLLAAAFAEGRPELFPYALQDRIHEPYRGALCPLLAPLRSLAGHKGILGAVLSGAGPSVLLLLDPRVSASATERRIAGFLRAEGLHAELLLTAIESRGACQRRRVLRPTRSREDQQ